MFNFVHRFMKFFLLVILLLSLVSCKKLEKFNQKPNITSLQHGLKTCVALSYCASLVYAAENGFSLPKNVLHIPNSGILYIKFNESHKLPFNSSVGDVFVAYLWNENGGVMSVLFSYIDILGGDYKLFGINTVPIVYERENNSLISVVAEQDIIVGYGNDTILDMSNISNTILNSELSRVEVNQSSDPFVVIQQNIWLIKSFPNETHSNLYDDDIIIYGGGQMAEVIDESGGLVYHALIDCKVNISDCEKNPIYGTAVSQNFKGGGETLIDLATTSISFSSKCDGKAHVDFSTGKYLGYSGKDIGLELQ